jgi:hypothetical protein
VLLGDRGRAQASAGCQRRYPADRPRPRPRRQCCPTAGCQLHRPSRWWGGRQRDADVQTLLGLELLAKSRIRIVTTEPDPATSEPPVTTEALTA